MTKSKARTPACALVHRSRPIAAAILLLAAWAPGIPTRAQVLPEGLPERFDSGLELGEVVAASTSEGIVLLGAPRPSPVAPSFRALVLGPNGVVVSTFFVRGDNGSTVATEELAPRVGAASGSFAVAGRSNGDFLFAWERGENNGASSAIVAREFNVLGEPVGAEQVMSTPEPGMRHIRPSVACNRVGRCAIAWITQRPLPSNPSFVQGRILDVLSHPTHESFVIEPEAGGIGFAQVQVANDGRIGVTYAQGRRLQPPFHPTIVDFFSPWSQVYDALGNALGRQKLADEVEVVPSTVRGFRAVGAFNAEGELLAAWPHVASAGTPSRIRVQRLDLFGEPAGSATDIDGGESDATAPSLVWDAAGERFVAGWLRLEQILIEPFGLLQSNELRLLGADGRPVGEPLVLTSKIFAQFGHLLEPPALAAGDGSEIHAGWPSTPNFGIAPATALEHIVLRPGPPACEPLTPGGRPTCADLGPAGRLRVLAAYRGNDGRSRAATLETITPNAAFLFFQGQQNPEVVAKVLDGRTINDHLWYFSGAMSNQEYAVSVYDQETGRGKVFFNPQDQLRSLADTGTFNDDELAIDANAVGAGFNPAPDVAPEMLSRGQAIGPDFTRAALNAAPTISMRGAGCSAATTTSLCLNQNRFRVEITFRDLAGTLSLARAVQTTTDGGYFTFFNPNNVEVALKILDGTTINGRFWVFYASLSNVRFIVRIFDSNGALIRTYVNPRDTLQSVADTNAF